MHAIGGDSRFRAIGLLLAVVGFAGLVVAGISQSAFARARSGAGLRGNNVCAITAGTLSFSPALHKRGNGQRSFVSLRLRLRHCSRTAARRGSFTGSPSFFLANDSCHSLFAPPPAADPVHGSILWAPRSANRSTEVAFRGRSESFGPPVRFKLFKGTAFGGSFDGSARSRFALKETRQQIESACHSSHGLAQLTVKSGHFKVGPKY